VIPYKHDGIINMKLFHTFATWTIDKTYKLQFSIHPLACMSTTSDILSASLKGSQFVTFCTN